MTKRTTVDKAESQRGEIGTERISEIYAGSTWSWVPISTYIKKTTRDREETFDNPQTLYKTGEKI